MDASFIQQNQIIERYLMGRLPVQGAQDFERFCRENPDTVTQMGLADRINAALRLLDASGQPEPWTEKPQPRWQRPQVVIGLAAMAVVLLIITLTQVSSLKEQRTRIQAQQQQLQQQPLSPVQSTRSITIEPSRQGPTSRVGATIGGERAELVDLKFDMSWATFDSYHVTINRIDQGLFEELGNVTRDSNGHLRIALNSSALGPGDYAVTIEGLDRLGKRVPLAWARIRSTR